MRIGVDVRCLGEGRRTGVEEYTLNLLNSLFSKDQKNEYVLFFNSFNSAKIDFSWIEKYENVKLKRFNYPNKLLNFLFWYLNWPKIDKLIGGVDVFFMPNIIFSSVSNKTKLFVTIHDLSFERYPETFSIKRRLWHLFVNPKKICRLAHKIITVSESSKNDLVDIYKIDSKKISVIYSGVSDKFRVINRNDENLITVKDKYKLPYNFILCLSTIEPRKNIISVLKAYKQFQKECSATRGIDDLLKYKLVIAGSSGWLSKKIINEIEHIEFKDNILSINFVDDGDKEYLYNLASIFVYPSFFEGFGFPVLEAMKCGTPVVCSNNSSIPEIAGSGAILIDPHRPSQMVDAFKSILMRKSEINKIIDKGIKQANRFDWNISSEQLLTLISK